MSGTVYILYIYVHLERTLTFRRILLGYTCHYVAVGGQQKRVCFTAAVKIARNITSPRRTEFIPGGGAVAYRGSPQESVRNVRYGPSLNFLFPAETPA